MTRVFKFSSLNVLCIWVLAFLSPTLLSDDRLPDQQTCHITGECFDVTSIEYGDVLGGSAACFTESV